MKNLNLHRVNVQLKYSHPHSLLVRKKSFTVHESTKFRGNSGKSQVSKYSKYSEQCVLNERTGQKHRRNSDGDKSISPKRFSKGNSPNIFCKILLITSASVSFGCFE